MMNQSNSAYRKSWINWVKSAWELWNYSTHIFSSLKGTHKSIVASKIEGLCLLIATPEIIYYSSNIRVWASYCLIP
jgi:hypothetical protein